MLYVYQLHIFFEDRLFFIRESLTRNYGKCLKGLLSLVGYLMHLRHSWQNRENDKGQSIGSRIKRFEYRSFLWAENQIAHNFAKSCSHGNTIEDLANMMVFLLVRNFISMHDKTWYVLFQKRLFNGLMAPFYLVLITCSHYRFASGTS